MDRAFGFPHAGFGHFGHSHFFNPFFPRRRFVPFFFLSPFFFPFFRGEDDRDGMYFTHHQCTEGDTMGTLAEQYNVPQPILEAMNPHIQNPQALGPGHTAYIPRLDKMYCHKMYLEQDGSDTSAAAASPMSYGQQTMPPYTGTTYPGTPYSNMYSGQQTPYPYTNTP